MQPQYNEQSALLSKNSKLARKHWTPGLAAWRMAFTRFGDLNSV